MSINIKMIKINWEESLEIINLWEFKAKTEKVFLCEAHDRVLAEKIITDVDFPNVSVSKIEGYACRLRDVKNEIEIIDFCSFESGGVNKLGKNQCVKVYPGDVLPSGADVCLPLEKIEIVRENFIKLVAPIDSQGIIPKGSDKNAGEIVLEIGTKIGSSELGLLAATGNHEPGVYFKPKVGVYSFGKNLVEPMFMPFGNKERNSSGTLLTWLAKNCGVEAEYSGILKNDSETISDLKESLIDKDLLIVSGLDSKVDRAPILSMIQELAFEIKFDEVDIYPGGNIVFATALGKAIICLFGSSLATANAFELIIKPLLYKLKGREYKTKFVNMILENDYIFENVNSSNCKFFPGIITSSGNVEPIEYSGIDNAYILSKSEVMLKINASKREYRSGDSIKAYFLKNI